MAFDAQGNLYVTDWGTNNVTEFSPSGTPLGNFGSGTGFPGYAHPESIVFDAAGQVYVGNTGVHDDTGPIQPASTAGIDQFDAQGHWIRRIRSGTRADGMDPAADNRTMSFPQEPQTTKRFDIQTRQLLSDFLTTPATNSAGAELEAYALRI